MAKAQRTEAGLALAETFEVWADGSMTIREAAEFLSLGQTTLFKLMGEGELATTKVGARRLIARRSLVALLAKNAVPVTAPA